MGRSTGDGARPTGSGAGRSGTEDTAHDESWNGRRTTGAGRGEAAVLAAAGGRRPGRRGCGGSLDPGRRPSGSWSASAPEPRGGGPDGRLGVGSTGCRARRPAFCAAVDELGRCRSSGTGPTGRRRRRPRPDEHASIRSSCTSPTFCVRPERPGGRRAFDGTTWTTTVAVGPRPHWTHRRASTEVSCVSPTFCASVNTAGVVASLFDGTTLGPRRRGRRRHRRQAGPEHLVRLDHLLRGGVGHRQHRHVRRDDLDRASRRRASRCSTRSRAATADRSAWPWT